MDALDLNAATKKQLVRLKGVGPRLADRILRARPFERLDALLEVPGIGSELLADLRAQGARVEPPGAKPVRIIVRTRLELPEELPEGPCADRPEDLRPTLYVFDEEGRFLGTARGDRKEPRLRVPRRLLGRDLTVFVGPPLDLEEDAITPARLRGAGFPERRALLEPEGRDLLLGHLRLDPRLFLRSCCRVRGRVFRRIRLPNGTTRDVPLCNARVRICEVDLSRRLVIEQLPPDLLLRLRDDVLRAGRVDARLAEAGLVEVAPRSELDAVVGPLGIARGQGHAVGPVRLPGRGEGEVRTDLPAAGGPEETGLRLLAGRIAGIRGVEALRRELVVHAELLAPIWCGLDWLRRRYRLACLKTVEPDPAGRFDTHLHYFCYGDKPDLYFQVEQRCHEGEGWTTVHAPSIHCSTRWDYCCGEEVEIRVTNPAAATGRSAPCEFPYVEGDPTSVGEWVELPYDSQVFAVHAALLRTGKVLLFSGGAEGELPLESRVWDPATEAFSAQTLPEDLFCAHQVTLADGRVLVMGGSNYTGPHGRGTKFSFTFDPLGETWTRHPDMSFGRWYPTAALLPDGQAIALSGRDVNGPVVDEMEVFDPGADTWSVLPSSANKDVPIYPSLHLMRDGRVFYSGCRWAGNSRAWPSPPVTAAFDPTSNTWTNVGAHVITNRTEGTSVLLPPAHAMSMEGHEHGEEMPPPPSLQRVLVAGGEADTEPNRASAEVIDLGEDSPAWHRIADMHHRRVNPNAVILPDRQVLVFGGVRKYKFDWSPEPVLEAELFDPTTEAWTRAASMANPRQYHSVGVLLPDGRVLASGTTSRYGNDTSMELYSPPYLFRGPRPRITGWPGSVGYGGTLEITSPDACRIDDVVLVRPAAITHHTDSEQRLVPLDFHREGPCGLEARIPDEPALLPPGYYMLFILDDCLIPSVARFVHVG